MPILTAPPTPPPATALDLLAERMGIEAEFRDARGNTVVTPAKTKQHLLAAMGIAAATETEAQSALDALDREEWLAPLDPVHVLRGDAVPWDIEIALPADTGEVSWRLIKEEGGHDAGHIPFADLVLVGERRIDETVVQRRRLPLAADLPPGYHRLELDPGAAATTLIVTPAQCWLPPAMTAGRRGWGVAIQLYLLCSPHNWGIGDFTDLRALVELVAPRGADVIGLNPLHAMFPDDPEHASPYSPESRLLLNVLNIDVAAVPELAACDTARQVIAGAAFQQRLTACRARHLVDYAEVASLKLALLEMLFEACQSAPGQTRWGQFEAFRGESGELLERNCRFLALREHFAKVDPAHVDWHAWPESYRDAAGPEVEHFAAEHRRRVDFHGWLQWVADTQLGDASAAAKRGGMTIGLYRDLAVGADRAGAETWANSKAVVSGAQVGAPPDIHNPAGQAWGLPPFNPRALRAEAYRSFVQLVRANMRHAGGLRIDHVMGLQHLYWVPDGQPASAGAYVQYPLDDLVGVLALESQRQQCLVVGEDLGTVPEGFRERMQAANVLSYRVLFFEQDTATGEFLPPADYPALAMAVVGSHDLPTLRGWWEGRDLNLKEKLGLFPGEGEAERQRHTRERDKRQLVAALRREGLIAATGDPDNHTLVRAAHAFLARTPSILAMPQIDDLTDEADPVNVPATSDEHPNWRRRLSMTLDELAARPRFADITDNFQSERHKAG